MNAESCRLPGSMDADESQVIARLLRCKRIAIVGLSDDSGRPSHRIALYLRSVGKDIVPVNPTHSQVLGMKCYAALEDVTGDIDLVNVFRRPEYCPDIVRQAIARKAKGVWLQSGIISEASRQLAQKAGIDFVQDRCIMVEHMSVARV